MIRVLHFTKVINKSDFIDVIIRNANASRFYMMASSYQGCANIEDPNYEQDKVPFFKLGIGLGWVDLFRGGWRLSKILRKERVDILHTHHYYEAIIGRIACALYPKSKHVIGRHYHNQFYLTTRGLKLKFYLFVESIINHYADIIVVPSSLIYQMLVEKKTTQSKVRLIPYGFDFAQKRYSPLGNELIHLNKDTLGWSGKFVIGNIGRHDHIKGQTYLLKAFKNIKKQISNSLLVMIGDGPIHQELISETQRLDISNSVIFLGWRRDAHELINLMDAIVHPTLQEAFPQLMIEVMALNKPLIITPVSGATDVVKDKINGYLVPFQDIASIQEAVVEIYQSPAKANELSQRAGVYVRQNFSIEKIILQFEDIYDELTTKK